jgi:carbohydrate kinase (thermoresistant glucokinase family)
MNEEKPLLLVVMGVSGCGKSTFSKAVSTALGLSLMDGDDLHSAESVTKMQAGIALDDADRWPWLDQIGRYLVGSGEQNQQDPGRVVACSALKRAYRDRIRHTAGRVHFIFLDGDNELIRSRMAARTGHFMQLDLLDSQLRTLERPTKDEQNIICVDTVHPVDQLVAQVIAALQTEGYAVANNSLQTQ